MGSLQVLSSLSYSEREGIRLECVKASKPQAFAYFLNAFHEMPPHRNNDANCIVRAHVYKIGNPWSSALV
jgi:hypothetical protein